MIYTQLNKEMFDEVVEQNKSLEDRGHLPDTVNQAMVDAFAALGLADRVISSIALEDLSETQWKLLNKIRTRVLQSLNEVNHFIRLRMTE